MHRLSVLIIVFASSLACAQPAPAAKPEAAKPAAQQATVTFVIHPWGEVLVDGELKGISPPLKSIKLEPGERAIIIKKAGNQPYADTIIVKPGEELTIKHAFAK
jgi:hypothetical protein